MSEPQKIQWEGYAALACVPLLALAWLQLGLVFTWAATILPVFFALIFGLSSYRREDGASRACGIAALALIAVFVLLVFLPASRRH